jgi:hypothetical protein
MNNINKGRDISGYYPATELSAYGVPCQSGQLWEVQMALGMKELTPGARQGPGLSQGSILLPMQVEQSREAGLRAS